MLDGLLKNKNKHHGLMIVESKLSCVNDFIKSYIKSIVCTNDVGFCNNCVWCQKVSNENYYDIIEINGNKNKIKKEKIQNIVEQFSKTAVEERGKKIYIIKNVENATPSALNSILKFLEEPPVNVYAIFTTKNQDAVLDTIKSRTQIFTLKGDEKEIDFFLKTTKLKTNEKEIIKCVFYDKQEMADALNNDSFANAFCFAEELLENKNDLAVIKKLSDQFKKMDYETIKIIIKILMNMTRNNESLFILLNDISFNPIKILLFAKIVNSL